MEKTSVLAKLKQGDETSFTFVYDHYWRKVYRFSEIYLNDDEEIKEAVQEVLSNYGNRVHQSTKTKT